MWRRQFVRYRLFSMSVKRERLHHPAGCRASRPLNRGRIWQERYGRFGNPKRFLDKFVKKCVAGFAFVSGEAGNTQICIGRVFNRKLNPADFASPFK
jgi:hypothetical protein